MKVPERALPENFWQSASDFATTFGFRGRMQKTIAYMRRLRPNENHLIAMSDFVAKDFFKNHFIRPRYIIPVGIDTSLYSQRSSERDVDIIGVGSLTGSKQFDAFIEVVNELKEEMPDINTRIFGEGPEKWFAISDKRLTPARQYFFRRGKNTYGNTPVDATKQDISAYLSFRAAVWFAWRHCMPAPA